ncbi:MAG TPA: tyrosinase family protein [Micromonosporaceae bacterium]|nr:tyrosinase family protein [Micromonosporaceae bacterium]
MLRSQLFANDALLQSIADDNDRISRTRHSRGDSVRKVQTALLTWDPGALPRFGADAVYGNETAAAVRRFKIEELSVAPAQAIDDVGPRTVIRLDEIQAAAEAPPPPPPPTPTLFVRRDVWTLQSAAPWDPITIAYARAVRTMQARPMSDPTSWAFQAAIHASFVTPANPAWNGCQHASWFFLPWHRMYLFFFEKIVRAAVLADGGPSDFALPYWNYDQATPRNTLPQPFREPTLPDGTPNPLMLPAGGRSAGIQAGGQLRTADTDSSNAMASTIFTGPGGTTFGGGVSAPAHFDGESGMLELQPHNIIHVVVGGPRPAGATNCNVGLMTDPRCAALDPIFWLHHANIDRLWNRWLDSGGGRANPADSAWLTQQFGFFDETGTAVRLAGSDILDSATQLNYVYDDRPTPVAPPPRVTPVAPPPELGAATDQVIDVTRRVTARLVVPDSTRSLIERLSSRAVGAFLAIENIEAERNPGVVFDILLNERRVGTFSLFGIELMNDPDHVHDGAPGLRHTFDAAEVIASLVSMNRWDPDALDVTVEPVPPVPPPGEEPVAIEDLDLPPVRIGRIALFVAEAGPDLVA